MGAGGQPVLCQLTFLKKSLDKTPFVCYIITMKENMKKNNLPYIGKVQDINDEFNRAFRDKVFMPMVTFAVTIMFIAIILDYGFQLIEAIDIIASQ